MISVAPMAVIPTNAVAAKMARALATVRNRSVVTATGISTTTTAARTTVRASGRHRRDASDGRHLRSGGHAISLSLSSCPASGPLRRPRRRSGSTIRPSRMVMITSPSSRSSSSSVEAKTTTRPASAASRSSWWIAALPADVHAARRLVEQQREDVLASQASARRRPSAGCLRSAPAPARASRSAGRPASSASDSAASRARDRPENARPSQPREPGRHQVGRDRLVEEQALGLAVVGDERDTGARDAHGIAERDGAVAQLVPRRWPAGAARPPPGARRTPHCRAGRPVHRSDPARAVSEKSSQPAGHPQPLDRQRVGLVRVGPSGSLQAARRLARASARSARRP